MSRYTLNNVDSAIEAHMQREWEDECDREARAVAVGVADQVFCLHDGFYCIVRGRTFGTWKTREIAEAGMAVEQRRAIARDERCAA